MQDKPLRASCVVCGLADARSLSMTTLGDGDVVAVCGSHELSHLRSVRAGRTARTVAELVSLTAERRNGLDRRAGPSDELAGMLAEAFAPKRGRKSDRRKVD
jgi:acyl dehydratase